MVSFYGDNDDLIPVKPHHSLPGSPVIPAKSHLWCRRHVEGRMTGLLDHSRSVELKKLCAAPGAHTCCSACLLSPSYRHLRERVTARCEPCKSSPYIGSVSTVEEELANSIPVESHQCGVIHDRHGANGLSLSEFPYS
jgi:hypothetical protein